MESERNSIFSHAQSQSQGSKIRSQHGDESQRKNQYLMKNQQNEEAYMDDGGFQGKGKKIDIKKLIEQKQARQQKQKGVEVKEKNDIEKYYKKTGHSIIETCTICGYIIFTSDAQAKQQKKLAHLKIEHPQYSGIHKSNITCEQNTDEYVNIASQLVNFARDANNREQMQYIVGQYFPQKFQPYVQQLPIVDSLKKWTKLVEYAYKIYQ